MKLKFQIEDLAGLVLILIAGMIILVSFKAMSQSSSRLRRSSSPVTGTIHTLEDLPQIVAKPTTRAKRVATPVGREPNKGQLFKIGIIDTGFDQSLTDVKMHLCSSGHYDFGTGTPVVASTFWHGTAVAQTIVQEMDEDTNYCFVIYQVQGPLGITPEALAGALKKAANEGLIAVNISLEGVAYSFAERAAVAALTRKGTAVFIAAGNRHLNLDTACMSFPGCYGTSGAYVVGATQENGAYVANYSNYGSKVQVWKEGSIEFQGETFQGTSFASPRALGDYVSSLSFLAADR